MRYLADFGGSSRVRAQAGAKYVVFFFFVFFVVLFFHLGDIAPTVSLYSTSGS